MAAGGFTPEDYAHEVVEVWPENWPAWDLFVGLQTQWRIAPGGFTGLDYTVLNRELDDLELPRDERAQMKRDIQTMEYAALPVLNKPRKPAS